MKIAAAAALVLASALASAAPAAEVVHFPAASAPGGATPAFSAAVMAGNALYVSGVLDIDPATGKSPEDPKEAARRVLDSVKRGVEAGGLTMDDLVWVQVFCTDLGYYAAFNEVYRTYFKGPLPARAFIGTDKLLNGAHFEAMGVAYRK